MMRLKPAVLGLSSALVIVASSSAAQAQERVPIEIEPIVSSLPIAENETTDVSASQLPRYTAAAAQAKECDDKVDASQISGEIVVCAKRLSDDPERFSGSHEAWLKNYAERTRNFNTIPTPDVAGGGIFRGAPSISGLCLIPPCPKAPALLIDVEALPPPPAGSDADRISQGLPPLGQDQEPNEEEIRKRREALGLPPPAFEKTSD